MIVPQNRLLFWFGSLVPVLALVLGVEPALAWLAFTGIGGLVVVALVDAWGGCKNFQGIGAQLPPVVRLSKDRAGKIELRIRNESQRRRPLRLALPLPPEIHSPQKDLQVELPDGAEWSRLTWPCTPLKRGNFSIGSVHIESLSPLGLWAVRQTVAVTSELRIYPNLMKDRKSLAALFLNRGAFGLHAQRQVGKGRDFEKLREYVPGDGYDEIHWKATARRGKPITKVFQIEKTQEIYVVVDASRLTARVPGDHLPSIPADAALEKLDAPDSTLERFVTAALVLGLAAEQQGDLFGLLTFSNKVEKFVRAKNGKAHFSACRDALYTLQPQLVSPDFDELCTFIRLRLRRRSLLFFLTALDDTVLAESFVRNIDLLRRQHLVLVNMIQPPGVEPVFSNPNVATLDQLYQHLGGHLQWQKLRELEKVLKRRGVQFSLLQNERLSPELVSQYLNIKRRQLL